MGAEAKPKPDLGDYLQAKLREAGECVPVDIVAREERIVALVRTALDKIPAIVAEADLATPWVALIRVAHKDTEAEEAACRLQELLAQAGIRMVAGATEVYADGASPCYVWLPSLLTAIRSQGG